MARANEPTTKTGRRYLNIILTANALLLGGLALQGMGLSLTSLSHAEEFQPRSGDADDGGRISAAEQRKTMIAQLATLTQKVERVEAVLAKGVNVRVTEMPAGFGKSEAKGEDKVKGEGKSEIKARAAENGVGKK